MSNLYNLENKTKDNTMAKTGNMAVQNESSDSEKTKGGKKGKKAKDDSNPLTSKQAEVSDSITCHGCKELFIDEDSKILSCDRYELWFCIKCAIISEASSNFLASKKSRRHCMVLQTL